ncbi:MAG: hypothetical protein AB8B56_19255 [Crocinitomicaceae bacterium]
MKLLLLLFTSSLVLISSSATAQTEEIDLNVLVGQWKIDMSPQDLTDENFAEMSIKKVDENTFHGEFYRKGVKIKNAQINTQLDIIYCALTSGDNSGTYNTTFYYKDDILHGTTHSLGRNFLSVWAATKVTQ